MTFRTNFKTPSCQNKTQLKQGCWLVVSTPFEKYACQIGSFPQIGGENKNSFHTHNCRPAESIRNEKKSLSCHQAEISWNRELFFSLLPFTWGFTVVYSFKPRLEDAERLSPGRVRDVVFPSFPVSKKKNIQEICRETQGFPCFFVLRLKSEVETKNMGTKQIEICFGGGKIERQNLRRVPKCWWDLLMRIIIGWNYPPTSNSDHQDSEPFLVGNPELNLHFWLASWVGGRPKL